MRTLVPLTQAKLNAVRPSATKTILYDGGGLRHVVYPKRGRKPVSRAWVHAYVSPVTKRRTEMVLGSYPAMGLAEARRARDVQAESLSKGFDPKLERRRADAMKGLTLRAAADAWDAARVRSVDARTRETAMQRLRLHVFPTLGERPLASITPHDVRDVCDRIVKAGHEETAHRTHTILNQVFDWAEARGDVESNPSRRLRNAFPSPPSVHIAAVTQPDHFGFLLRAIESYSGHRPTRDALRLLPLVFVRSSELRCATWDEFDLDAARWTIPAHRMKRKENGDHIVPLARQSLTLLRELRDATYRGPGSRVFPGMRPGKPLSDNTLNAALTSLGFGPEVHRAHGFRSSASTMLNVMAMRADCLGKFNFEHIEVQLAHKRKDSSRDPYMRANFLEQRAAMMQIWADECDRMRDAAVRDAKTEAAE